VSVCGTGRRSNISREVLFDLSAEYEQMLNQGIRLSGESQEFFIRGRLDSLTRRLPSDFKPRRILDFGCGIGTATRHLAQRFPQAEIVGVDTSANALHYATEKWGSPLVKFRELDELSQERDFDLCYVNGVFHHIVPSERRRAAASIHEALRPGGRLALFENNPWNPGARMVMKRIPFDRDAIMLSVPETTRLVRSVGFSRNATSWSLFYFPRALAMLRWSEGALSHLPLGAQYCVYAIK
jgi:SAM-dependent methyltransferase